EYDWQRSNPLYYLAGYVIFSGIRQIRQDFYFVGLAIDETRQTHTDGFNRSAAGGRHNLLDSINNMVDQSGAIFSFSRSDVLCYYAAFAVNERNLQLAATKVGADVERI